MKRITKTILIALALTVTGAWGVRGHQSANLAAIRALPIDGPMFLRQYEEWISKTGPVPDS